MTILQKNTQNTIIQMSQKFLIVHKEYYCLDALDLEKQMVYLI